MTYDELLIEADNNNLIVKEAPLQSSDGRCKGRRIAIRQDIPTLKEKAAVLAEEMGHYYTTVGRIIEQDSSNARKQEFIARAWAYTKQLPLIDIIKAYKAHCRNAYDISEYLDILEEIVSKALDRYRQTYGTHTIIDGYYIQFEPYLDIGEYHTLPIWEK